MLDVLTALLLLAVALTVACVTLIQTLRTTHDALLATRAVDLAADLSEQLKQPHLPDEVDDLVAAWRERVRAALPVTGLAPDQFAAVVASAGTDEGATATESDHLLTLRWRGAHGNLEEISIPVVVWSGA